MSHLKRQDTRNNVINENKEEGCSCLERDEGRVRVRKNESGKPAELDVL